MRLKKYPEIRTERLLLRAFELSDAHDIKRLAGDKAIADTTTSIPHPYEDGMAEDWISTHRAEFEAGELLNLAVVSLASSELMGAIGLIIVPQYERAELGYWIGKPFWRKGYCTEAGKAVVQYGFDTLKLNRIYSYHFSRNPASGRVMQKIGMTYEGREPQHLKKWGKFEDLERYGIVREQWMELKHQ